MINHFISVVKNHYSDFEGRMSCGDYWRYFAVSFVLSLVTLLIAVAIDFLLLSNIVGIALFLPNLSAAVRRLHDVGKSTPWVFIAFIPIVGIFILLYFLIKDGEAGANQWGENPELEQQQF